MKRIKKIVLLFIILIVSGCSVEYNLTINRDSSVNEKVVAKEYTNRLKTNTGLDEKSAVNYLYSVFERGNLKTNMSYISKDGATIATVTGSHNSLEDYAENFNSDVFDRVQVDEDGDLVTLTIEQTTELGKDSSMSLIYDEIEVNISVPFKVKKSNADSSRNGTYTWNITKGDLKTITITYEKNSYKDEQKITIGGWTFNIRYEFIALFIIALIVAIIFVIVFIKNKKNNKV